MRALKSPSTQLKPISLAPNRRAARPSTREPTNKSNATHRNSPQVSAPVPRFPPPTGAVVVIGKVCRLFVGLTCGCCLLWRVAAHLCVCSANGGRASLVSECLERCSLINRSRSRFATTNGLTITVAARRDRLACRNASRATATRPARGNRRAPS